MTENQQYADAVDRGEFPADVAVPIDHEFTDERGVIRNILLAPLTSVATIDSREGAVSAKLANLFFQCACVTGARTVEEWDALVVAARSAEVSISEALEFGEE